MVAYIQTPNGLYPIEGQVTKSKIIEALGYTPSAFDGNYNSLNNRPEIIEDESDELSIVDSQGNIIFKVDSNGIHSVNLTINGKTINEVIQESTPSGGDGTSGSLNTNNAASLIPSSNESLAGGISLHKVSKTGDYNSLNNRPEIIEDESAELSIVDSQGNIVAKITSEGIQAVNFLVGENKDEVALAKDIPADGSSGTGGADGREVLFQVADGYIQWQYVGDSAWTDLVLLADLKGADGSNGNPGEDGVDGKSVELRVNAGNIEWRQVGGSWVILMSLEDLANTTPRDYNDLENKPIIEDESDELSIVDSQGNIVAKITSEGIIAVNFLAGENRDEVALAKDIPVEYDWSQVTEKPTNILRMVSVDGGTMVIEVL